MDGSDPKILTAKTPYPSKDTKHYMFFVCEKCLDEEPGLQNFISITGHSFKDCSYCNTANNYNKIKLNQLTAHILNCLKESYHIVKLKNIETIELLSFMEDHFPAKNENLFQSVLQSLIKEIGENYLIEKKAHINSWDNFSDYIKKESRFFFSEKASILQETMKVLKRNSLIQKIRPKKTIYRARAFVEGNRIVNDLRRMGPPQPADIINISNRMSPPGVPIFYGSFDEETALSEVSQKGREGCAYIAKFYLLREIIVIDLTLVDEPLPSFFDINEANRQKRNDLIFIKELSSKLSEPIDKDGREHTDYVPTQVLAEYIRKQKIHGIIYESGRKSAGKNIALFFSQKNCSKDSEITSSIFLKFTKKETTYNLPFKLSDD